MVAGLVGLGLVVGFGWVWLGSVGFGWVLAFGLLAWLALFACLLGLLCLLACLACLLAWLALLALLACWVGGWVGWLLGFPQHRATIGQSVDKNLLEKLSSELSLMSSARIPRAGLWPSNAQVDSRNGRGSRTKVLNENND